METESINLQEQVKELKEKVTMYQEMYCKLSTAYDNCRKALDSLIS